MSHEVRKCKSHQKTEHIKNILSKLKTIGFDIFIIFLLLIITHFIGNKISMFLNLNKSNPISYVNEPFELESYYDHYGVLYLDPDQKLVDLDFIGEDLMYTTRTLLSDENTYTYTTTINKNEITIIESRKTSEIVADYYYWKDYISKLTFDEYMYYVESGYELDQLLHEVMEEIKFEQSW